MHTVDLYSQRHVTGKALVKWQERFNAPQNRNRFDYAGLVLGTILLGLSSRKFAWLLPGLFQKNTGDILWAAMVFLLWALLFSRKSTGQIVGLAAIFSLGIELLKFYQAPWLETIRATIPGRLIFGYQFSWSNLICYLIGIGLGIVLELSRPKLRVSPSV